ncbi:MAG: hypothetical protein AVDCRST_MAG56-7287 [uncultured Cytophagales bacterium]|uniref:Uncharacterized protein n=1 Tax=uncultured Cytophagales bacterium TaxID=158755 RepID=A0A6J4LCI4_9SPHI|nr:MAG: hypothetical protein AVDCRST_MAG56-7287 [uncultured Cytophagales bacterium]
MRTRKPSISVRLALIAERYRAIVEKTENCYLTMQEIAALSVSGYTLEEARGKLQSVLNALRHKQKLPGEVTLRLAGPGRPSGPAPDSFS